MAVIQTPRGRIIGLILPKDQPEKRPDDADKKDVAAGDTEIDHTEKTTRKAGRLAKK